MWQTPFFWLLAVPVLFDRVHAVPVLLDHVHAAPDLLHRVLTAPVTRDHVSASMRGARASLLLDNSALASHLAIGTSACIKIGD